jgi:hypothetical protein
MNWFIRMCILIVVVCVEFWLATLLEKYNTQIMAIVKKIVCFLMEVAEDILIIVLVLFTS